MRKILLTQVTNRDDMFQTAGVNSGLLALEAFASKNGNKEIILTDDPSDISRIKPDLVGLSAVTASYGNAIETAKLIKSKLNIPVIVGGAHITSLPESLDPIFDAGVIGEGEETFLELINSFPKLNNIDGIVHWIGKTLAINKRRPPIADLDTLPLPNRKKWIDKIGMAYLMTTRGCPYKCSFCSSPVIWGGCRAFSPERVILEVKDIVSKFKLNYLLFFDDVFTLNKSRLKKIVEGLSGEGLTKDVCFSCLGRINMIDNEVVQLLKTGNVKYVFVGIEFTSKSLLERYKDQPPTLQASQRTIDLLYDQGIRVRCSFIVGAPNETERDLENTYRFIEKNEKKLYEIEINPLVAYPGTEIWKYAFKRGLVSNNMDWSKLKEYSFILTFNPNKYIYLNGKVSYSKFVDYIKKFQGLFHKISLDPKNIDEMKQYFKPGDLPATFKRP